MRTKISKTDVIMRKFRLKFDLKTKTLRYPLKCKQLFVQYFISNIQNYVS